MRIVEYQINEDVVNPSSVVKLGIKGGVGILNAKAKGGKPTLFILKDPENPEVKFFTVHLVRNNQDLPNNLFAYELKYIGTIFLPEVVHVFAVV